MNFTKDDLRRFRKDFDQAVGDLAEKYQIHLKLGTMRYDDHGFRATLEATERGHDPQAEAFKTHCGLFGLKPTDLGKTFIHKGEVYKVTGLALKRRKYPIITFNERRGEVLFTEQVVKLINPTTHSHGKRNSA